MLCRSTTSFLRLSLARSAASSHLVRTVPQQQPRSSIFLAQLLGPWKSATFTTSSSTPQAPPPQKVPIPLIKELRTRTGAGMNDCRDALVQSSLDVEKAIEVLKQKGQTSADRVSKKTGEGVVYVSNQGGSAILAEINCDTDFVARTNDFREFATAVVQAAANTSANEGSTNLDVTSLLENPFHSETLATRRKTLEKILGESVVVSRVLKIRPSRAQGEFVGAYQHGDLGKFAGAVTLRLKDVNSTPVNREELQKLADKLAVHIVGFSPKSIEVEKEPETALLEQEFSVWENHPADRTLAVKEVLEQAGAQVVKFVRWSRGELV